MKRMEKQFKQFMTFIARIKAGETGCILATDYVVMDLKTYNKLTKNDQGESKP